MRISRAGTAGSRGFTFIELTVVIFIIALFAATVAPRLIPFLSASRLDGEASRLALLLEHLRDEALLGRRGLVLRCGIDEGQFALVPAAAGEPTLLERPLALGKAARVVDIDLPGRGRKTEGEALIAFYPSGGADRAFIHLRGDDGREVTLELPSFARKVVIHDGYVEGE